MHIRDLLASQVFWSAIGAIGVALTGVGVFLLRDQLRFQAWLRAQEIWTERGFTAARGRIFARLDGTRTVWSPEEEQEALDVCRKLDEFAGLIPYLPKGTALQVWGVPFGKAWLILAPIVNRERKRSGWGTKWDAFERLGTLGLKKYPEAKIRGVDSAS